MKTIHHVVELATEPSSVYRAIVSAAGLSGWWSTAVSASSEQPGGLIHFTFAGDFNPVMEIADAQPAARIVWRCVGGHEPWANNTFRFELVEHDAGTRLRFWQDYAIELDDDAYGTYNFNWGYYLESLRVFCETGSGKPFAAAALAAGS